jgi:hypothetical protein
VGVPVDEHLVLEGAGLRLVGVDDEVARLVVLREELPLLPRREAGAAASAKAALKTSSTISSALRWLS